MLEVALVGAGVMGSNHARVLAQFRDARLAWVVDPDRERADIVAAAYGARAAGSVEEILGTVDAAILATPTAQHAQQGVALLNGGAHLLVEKPIAGSLADANALVSSAAAAERVLQVGHVERFNPAVLELDSIVDAPIHLSFQRVGPFSPRVSDGVILDLMIHDLDLARSIARSEVAEVQSVARATRSDSEDIATALLTFENGVTAALTASRVGQTKIREITITQQANFVAVDLLRQALTIHRVDHAEFLSGQGSTYRQTGVVEVPFLENRGEPLALELAHFLSCVTEGTTPRVSGADGVAALDLAMRVSAAAVRS